MEWIFEVGSMLMCFLVIYLFRIDFHAVFNDLSQVLDRGYAYVAVAAKALPEVIPTFSLAPFLDNSPAFPVYVLLQNRLGIKFSSG
jgi:hypothetical protein